MRTNYLDSIGHTHFSAPFSIALFAAVLVSIAGCDHGPNAKPIATVEQNASAVDKSAASNVAEVERQPDSNAYTVTLARAEGAHNVALQKCEALSGQDQKTCKDNADADYDAAKANAKPTKPMQPVAPTGSP